MATKVLIVEDEMLLAEDIATDLAAFGFEITGMFTSGEACINAFNNLQADIIVMDIRIRGRYDGIETAQRINAIRRTAVVYLTSNTDRLTLTRLLDLFPSAYITKPYHKTDLMMAIEMAVRSANTPPVPRPEDTLLIKAGAYYKKLNLPDICYLEADGSYTRIHLKKESHIVSYNLRHFENTIRAEQFIRIHRSYIVNTAQVEGISGHFLLISGKKLPVSKSFRNTVQSLFHKL